MPSALKEALVREVAREGGSLNDLATGMLARRFRVPFTPSGRTSPLPGSSPVVLLRMPSELKSTIQAEAFSSGSNTKHLCPSSPADELGVPFTFNALRSA